MPKLRQPTTLRKRSFNVLVAHVVYCCDSLSVNSYLRSLREGVADIKKLVYSHVPVILFAEFCQRFLSGFYDSGVRRSGERPDSHYKAVLEIMMDVKIVGLRCEGHILRFLSPRDAERLLGLNMLDLRDIRKNTPKSLNRFRFEHLTTFILPRICSDSDLEIIGSCCPKLQFLCVEESKMVTDKGLHALIRCSELRVLDLHYCAVTDDGMNALLSANSKIEEFNIGRYYARGEKSFDVLSRKDYSPCLSIKRFSLKSNPITNEHLDSVVVQFPNLTHLRICCPLVGGDLRTLKDLRKLTELNFSYGYRCFAMHNLKQLLIIVGANISVLHILGCNPNVCVTQTDLDFFFKICCNMQSFEFDYDPNGEVNGLVIPCFKNLKILECCAVTEFRGIPMALEFGQMPALETLTIRGFDVNFQSVLSMMLDSGKFPNLTLLRIPYAPDEDVSRIMRIAKARNLDFLYKNTYR